MSIKQKHALITGGTSGIGYELAKLLAKDGYNLVIVARNQIRLDEVAKELSDDFKIQVISYAKDLFEPNSSNDVFDFVKARGIQVDILVNDAGQGQYGEFIDNSLDREIDIIQLNIISVVSLTKHFLKEMVSRGEGKILNVASVAGKIPGPLQAVYHGTKAFVHSFTEAIRNEVKDSGVTITSLLPGATATDFFSKADMLDAKNVQDGKLADPADVAKDGYNALMKGADMVVAGFMNKVQVAMSNVIPDAQVAEQVHKQQAPKENIEKQHN